MFKSWKKIFLSLFLFLALFWVASDFALAQDFGTSYINDLGLTANADPRVVAIKIIKVLLTFLGVVAISIILYGGWLWMTSNGDAQKIEKAKKTLISAVIGLLIILSSFAIVSFVLNQITEVLDGGGCNGGPACVDGNVCCGALGCMGSCPTGSFSTEPFQITRVLPYVDSMNVVRNVAVRAFLNKPISIGVTQADLNNNFIIEKVADIDEVDMSETAVTPVAITLNDIEISPNRMVITARAAAGCGDEVGTTNCFDEWDKLRVRIDGWSGIDADGPEDLDCSGGLCLYEFGTGNLIDGAGPTAGIIPTQICQDDGSLLFDANTVKGWGRDDIGIAEIRFYQGATLVHTEPGAAIRRQTAEYKYDTTGFTIGASYDFQVQVDDMASNLDDASFSTIVRPGHCCNGTQDAGETGTDCGGDCLSCQGGSCSLDNTESCGAADANCSDSLCYSQFCGCQAVGGCICQAVPMIDWIAPAGGFCRDASGAPTDEYCKEDGDCASSNCDQETPNAAIGNLITIGGQFFGSVPGTVTIDGVNAPLASVANPDCTGAWQDRQIVVEVPVGVSLGEAVVEVMDSTGTYSDTNDNDRGLIFDFIINNISRPGICASTPEQGVIGTEVDYGGIELLPGTNAFFGNTRSSVAGINSIFTDPTGSTGSTYVPGIGSGRTTTFVESVLGINSNYLSFLKDSEPNIGPYISYFSPITGRSGQYVTIYGGGFGEIGAGEIGVSRKVYFSTDTDVSTDTGTDQVEASYVFPDVCLSSLWSDNRIIVKVPDGLSNGIDYYLIVESTAWDEVIDSSGVIAPGYSATFNYNETLPLQPSLCRINPQVGPNNSPVELFGEYFGENATGQVRFSSDILQGGFSSVNWKSGEGEGSNKYDYIATLIPQEAVTGPVQVVQGGMSSEGLNLRVGSCTSNDDCEHVCCGAGSMEEGRCVDSADQCYAQKGSSVFEWRFDTGTDVSSTATDSPMLDFGCSGYDLLQCHSTFSCPNSPGMCGISPYSPPLKSCDCDEYFPGLSLTYNPTINRCVNNSSTCSVDEDVSINIGGVIVSLFGWNASCNSVGGASFWQIDPKRLDPPQMNCPVGSVLDANGLCSLATSTMAGLQKATCDLCPTGNSYSCVTDGGADNMGRCAVTNKVICSTGTVCNTGTEKCENPGLPDESCECCCRKDSTVQDCCTFEYGGEVRALECAGSCGGSSDYGVCSGCRIESSPGVVDQVASDSACNCSGTSGKFCDADVDVDGDGSPEGACRDCTLLSPTSCSEHVGATTCCFDEKNDFCRGNANGLLLDSLYCGYYNCDDDICDATPVTVGEFSSSDCNGECSSDGLPGGSSCFDETAGNCGLTCGSPYSCFGSSGCAGGACGGADTSCACCCNPSIDTCSTISPSLICKENQTPCSGDNRGLCCGCESDDDCVAAGDPISVGCSDDTCCRPRPQISSTLPVDEDVNVCRNAVIVGEFDQQMDVTTLTNNILVFADYGTEMCPRGTQYLVADSRSIPGDERSRFTRVLDRIWEKVLSILDPFISTRPVHAYSTVPIFNNYCSISGSVSSYVNASGNGVFEFTPSELLDPGMEYYVVVKGDQGLNSEKGVKSFWGVGMNGNDNNGYTFNGVSYENSHIFSFITMPNQGTGNNYGICKIDTVKITPSSYLFQTSVNDLNEADNDALASSFDGTADSDKLFSVQALGNGDVLATSTAYDWTWSWNIDNVSIVDFVGGVANLSDDKRLVRAQEGVTDGNTVVRAVANVFVGGSDSFLGTSNVYVFECKNPWPPVDASGIWSPWSDSGTNCTYDNNNCGPSGTDSCCGSTNFEFYYCRDNGTDSTYDDLAAILSNDAVVRAKDAFRCKGGFYSGQTCILDNDCDLPTPSTGPAYSFECGAGGICTASNGTVSATGNSCFLDSDCQENGVCTGNLKEILYFREDLPDVSAVSLSVAAIASEGGTVSLSWNDVVGVDTYRLYRGTAAGVYGTDPLMINPTDNHSAANPYLISGLNNGTVYYFVVTAVRDSVESTYSNEVSATPKDSVAPFVPANFLATPADGAVDLTWDAVVGADRYEVCYSKISGNCAVSEYVEANSLRVVVENGTELFFFVRAVDEFDNISANSIVRSATPSVGAVGFFSSGDVVLKWNISGDVGDYILYYEEVE